MVRSIHEAGGRKQGAGAVGVHDGAVAAAETSSIPLRAGRASAGAAACEATGGAVCYALFTVRVRVVDLAWRVVFATERGGLQNIAGTAGVCSQVGGRAVATTTLTTGRRATGIFIGDARACDCCVLAAEIARAGAFKGCCRWGAVVVARALYAD